MNPLYPIQGFVRCDVCWVPHCIRCVQRLGSGCCWGLMLCW